MDYPLITVGLTCFNAERTIERAVRSALAQAWPNLEVLVVDDGSNDGSVPLLQRLATADKRLRLIQHEQNRGTAAARNSLIERAAGEFLAFFDDDDTSEPDRLTLQYRRISDYEAAAGTKLIACYASGRRIYPNGYEIELDAIGSNGGIPIGEAVADYILFNARQPDLDYGAGTPTCSLMARRQVFLSVGGFDPEFRRVEDVDFSVRLALRGGHFIGCPERLFTQYATTGSHKSATANFEAENRLLDKHRDYLEGRNRYRYAKNWFLVRYHHFRGAHFHMLLTLIRAWVRHPLLVTRHFLASAPRRLRHELKMSKRGGNTA